jgi:hypothetical protein
LKQANNGATASRIPRLRSQESGLTGHRSPSLEIIGKWVTKCAENVLDDDVFWKAREGL